MLSVGGQFGIVTDSKPLPWLESNTVTDKQKATQFATCLLLLRKEAFPLNSMILIWLRSPRLCKPIVSRHVGEFYNGFVASPEHKTNPSCRPVSIRTRNATASGDRTAPKG